MVPRRPEAESSKLRGALKKLTTGKKFGGIVPENVEKSSVAGLEGPSTSERWAVGVRRVALVQEQRSMVIKT